MVLRPIIRALVGGGVGFVWYRWVACSSGTCPLLYNPYTGNLFGIVLGILIATNLQ